MPTNMFERIITQIIAHLKIQPELITIGGSDSPATTHINIAQKYAAVMLKTSLSVILQ